MNAKSVGLTLVLLMSSLVGSCTSSQPTPDLAATGAASTVEASTYGLSSSERSQLRSWLADIQVLMEDIEGMVLKTTEQWETRRWTEGMVGIDLAFEYGQRVALLHGSMPCFSDACPTDLVIDLQGVCEHLSNAHSYYHEHGESCGNCFANAYNIWLQALRVYDHYYRMSESTEQSVAPSTSPEVRVYASLWEILDEIYSAGPGGANIQKSEFETQAEYEARVAREQAESLEEANLYYPGISNRMYYLDLYMYMWGDPTHWGTDPVLTFPEYDAEHQRYTLELTTSALVEGFPLSSGYEYPHGFFAPDCDLRLPPGARLEYAGRGACGGEGGPGTLVLDIQVAPDQARTLRSYSENGHLTIVLALSFEFPSDYEGWRFSSRRRDHPEWGLYNETDIRYGEGAGAFTVIVHKIELLDHQTGEVFYTWSSNETASSCPRTRLGIGDQAWVSLDPPDPNTLRTAPGGQGDRIALIQPGESVTILDGPRCASSRVYWFVSYFNEERELTGWTAEGEGDVYWLIPYDFQPPPS